jgi:arylsulfatase A-like enzyme
VVRLLPSLLLFAVAAAQQPASPPAAKLAGTRPNLIFVYSDDHAGHAISTYGSKLNETPHLDRIADEGVRFDNAFCGNSLCGPARASIQTGLHSHKNGFMRNGNRFDATQRSLGKELQKVGYQTAVIGKWHLESDPVGYNHWMVLPGQGQYYNPDFLTKDGRQRIEGHATDLTMDLALDWLQQRDQAQPFLLLCQFKAPHRNWMPAPADLSLYRDNHLPEPATLFDDYEGRTPAAKAQEMTIARHMFLHYDLLVPPKEGQELQGEDRAYPSIRARMTQAQRDAWDAAYAQEDEAFYREDPQGEARVRWYYQRYMKNYLRCIAGIDRNVGRLQEWLDGNPEVKNRTLVVYCSDQGFYLGDHGWYDKRWMYEESLRMPLLMSWPGKIAPSRALPQLVQNIDIMPTFLELAGVPVPGDVHGMSLVPLLEGRADAKWRNAIYYHYYESHAVHMVPAMYGVRTSRYKLIRYYEPQWNGWEMFDLDRDPQEMRSVADDPRYAKIRKELERLLGELREQYGDDTGEVAGERFPIQAGVARVRATDGGWQVWCNADQGYLLQEGKRAGKTVLSTTMAPGDAGQQKNGFLVVAGGDPRGAKVRAGIEFGTKKLVVVGPGNVRAEAPIVWSGAAPAEVTMTIDTEAGTVVAEALGKRVEAKLPKGWAELTAWGFGASNAETRFAELVVK